MSLKVLVLGSGGREAAILWKLYQSTLGPELFVAPGNPAMEKWAQLVDIQVDNISALVEFARSQKINLTIVGPELPLSLGIVDAFQKVGLTIFGPTQFCAQLETSKAFAKNMMVQAKIPTAKFKIATDFTQAQKIIDAWPSDKKIVVKASELAQGKGVIVCADKNEAREAVNKLFHSTDFGVQSQCVVLEEGLSGKELSAFYICAKNEWRFLGLAQDHKRLKDHDQGPNTGGMGTVSPPTWVKKNWPQKIGDEIVTPILQEMSKSGHPFTGILFVGLMIDGDDLQVLEFNTRLGDPETQVLLPRMKGDLLEVLLKVAQGNIDQVEKFEDNNVCAIHVVKAAHGYPGVLGEKIRRGDEIKILAPLEDRSVAFFAGVSSLNGKYLTNGGRVLGVTSWGEELSEVKRRCYGELKKITFAGEQMRSDIGE